VSRRKINSIVDEKLSRRRINGYIVDICVEEENKQLLYVDKTVWRRRINGYVVDNFVEEENKWLCR
jgi:hypothetical protein